MDLQIMRAIVRSHGEVMKETKDPKGFERSLEEERFPPMDPTVLAALARSFGDLVNYKVSPEAYQRYSVRIRVIEVLREWIRPCKELDCSRTFYQSERVLDFVSRLLRVYLSNELLREAREDVLVNLAKALTRLIPRRKSLVRDLERILERICDSSERSESGERLLEKILEDEESLELGPEIAEKLCVVRRSKFIEAPLLESLTESLRRDAGAEGEFECSPSIDRLMRMSLNSPTVFHISCSVLKEIFVATDYASRVLTYIGQYRDRIDALCRLSDKNILDLYPLRLQALVILLRIEAPYHTRDSLEHAISSLLRTHESNPEETLVLLTHFPGWLRALADRITAKSIEETDVADSMGETSSVEWI